jgi:hypothetical protein
VSRDTEREVASLEALWTTRPTELQGPLVDPTRRLIALHGDLDGVALLRLHLANFHFRHRHLQEAENLLTPLLRGRAGIAQDEAVILLAEIRIEQGRGDEALTLLTPLGPRLLTDDARTRHAEAMVRAALRARRWRVGVQYLVLYLSEAHHERTAVRAFLDSSLGQVPLEARRRMLEDFPEEELNLKQKDASSTVQRLLVEGLEGAAISQNDPRLARDLIDHGPVWLRRGERGERLSLLAAQALDHTQVVSRIVGTVLGGAGSTATRRSIEATSGISEVLSTNVTLLTEDHRDSISQSLAALVGQGASLLIAGVDDASALEALSFAAIHEVPLIALSSTEGAAPKTSHFGFILGPSTSEQYAALAQQLAPETPFLDGAARLPKLSVLPASCSDPTGTGLPGLVGTPTVWFVLSDRACAEAVQLHFRDLRHPPRLALGLEASEARASGNYYLCSHAFPNDSSTTRAESLYRALGRDAARLAEQALTEVALPKSNDASSRHTYQKSLSDALAAARGTLETSAATGFSGQNQLTRSYTVERQK